MIQLVEQAMKTGYDKILTDLARPTSTTRAQTMGLPADDFDEFDDFDELDELVRDHNLSVFGSVAPPPVLTTIHVPPAVAPQQVSCVASQPAGAAKQHRRCFYIPFCVKSADYCGGWRDGACSRVNIGEIGRPSPEQLHSAKEEKRRVAKARLQAEQEIRKKTRKTKSI